MAPDVKHAASPQGSLRSDRRGAGSVFFFSINGIERILSLGNISRHFKVWASFYFSFFQGNSYYIYLSFSHVVTNSLCTDNENTDKTGSEPELGKNCSRWSSV